MATIANNFIPTAANLREMSTVEGLVNTDTVLQLAVANVLRVAALANLYTTTVSISGKTAENIQEITNALQNLGYTWSISSTTLTISW